MTADRKREAHHKILLGGIVARAGLSRADRAFLLGGLLQLARVVPGSDEHRRLRAIGAAAFKVPPSAAVCPHLEETAEWH